MIVVSDTSPITSLLQTDHSGILPRLFHEVLIPPAVQAELLRFHTHLPEWLEVRPIVDRREADLLGSQLDRGEAEAIALARECRADYLLIDEKRGRQEAEARGLRAIGLLGVLLLAKRAGELPCISDLIDQLEVRAGFFVSERVKAIILRAAGEAV